MYEIIDSVEINYRKHLSKLCNRRDIKVAVEVGTDRGEFAAQFMEEFEGELICVDPYESQDEFKWGRMPDMLMAILALQKWHGRVRILQNNSLDAAACFPAWLKARLGFVYIDGQHDFQSVRDDIETWWPLLKENGILAGHDYCNDHRGVIEAVNGFAEFTGRTVRIIRGDWIPSWMIYKGEPDNMCIEFHKNDTINNSRYVKK